MGILIRLDLIGNKELNVKVLNDDECNLYDGMPDIVADFNVAFSKKQSGPIVNYVGDSLNTTKRTISENNETTRTVPHLPFSPLRDTSDNVQMNDFSDLNQSSVNEKADHYIDATAEIGNSCPIDPGKEDVYSSGLIVSTIEINAKYNQVLTNCNEDQSMNTSINSDNHYVDMLCDDMLNEDTNSNFSSDVFSENCEGENKQSDPLEKRQLVICSECGKTFKKKSYLSAHIRHSHKIIEPNSSTCSVCGYTYCTLRRLQSHEQKDHGIIYVKESLKHLRRTRSTRESIEPFKNETYDDRETVESLDTVDNLHDVDENLYDGNINEVDLPDQNEDTNQPAVVISSEEKRKYQDATKPRKFHMRKVKITSKKFRCSSCDQIFENGNTLKIHKTIHNGGQLYACSVCDRLFTFKFALKTHKRKHLEVGSFACSYCSQLFKTGIQLKIHEKMHERKSNTKQCFLCRICDISFANRSLLMDHKVTNHKKVKSYPCEICGKLFPSNLSLRSHLIWHTRR